MKMIQRNSAEGCIDENAPSAASHDSFQRVHIAYWSHWSQLTMSMADKKFNQMIKPIADILPSSCPCPACDLITWIRLNPMKSVWSFDLHLRMPRMEGWINFWHRLPTLQNCTHWLFKKKRLLHIIIPCASAIGRKLASVLECRWGGWYIRSCERSRPSSVPHWPGW